MRGVRTVKKQHVIMFVLLILVASASVLGFRHQWKLKEEAAEVKAYLEARHHMDFVLVEPLYNWKFGSYGGQFYPKKHPSIVFYAEKMQNGYVASSFVEEWWMKEAEKELTPLMKEKLGKGATISVLPVHGIDEDLNISYPIPSYKEVKSSLSVVITLNEKWKNDKERKQQMMKIVKLNQARNIEDTTFVFEDDDKTQYTISFYGAKSIKTIEQFDKQAEIYYVDAQGFLSEANIDGTLVNEEKEGKGNF
ncbi:hypothetical protein [Metabacillus iocasae]|uniref:Uncharacterized protein n=1 Tax=Priestia iocasae TaxID=2291674 RepID=A0ABS2QXG1_9BACI|nr:hypothetical protein [Metabacillus iocasae]MBM7703943.1 hypothetical protein [Metabacillus iocasae]